MPSRQAIKAQAKASFAHQRGTGILLFFVFALLACVCGVIPFLGLILVPVLSVGLVLGSLRLYRGEHTEVSHLFAKFGDDFGRCLGGVLWALLFTFLWSLLFWVPGIVKSYAYRMTPYILAECPHVRPTDAIKLSMRMTKGYKGALFVNDLSFIGWYLLSALTLDILGLVYVFPYYGTTQAGYYLALRDQALRDGVIHPQELA
ncbi:MAG: DUF975 family protein [Oscillospiraceae bacterium]|jgi:uncharacterized membrane protein|nr:DUF975 family protein [Oscillospiraceae bacterium]